MLDNSTFNKLNKLDRRDFLGGFLKFGAAAVCLPVGVSYAAVELPKKVVFKWMVMENISLQEIADVGFSKVINNWTLKEIEYDRNMKVVRNMVNGEVVNG